MQRVLDIMKGRDFMRPSQPWPDISPPTPARSESQNHFWRGWMQVEVDDERIKANAAFARRGSANVSRLCLYTWDLPVALANFSSKEQSPRGIARTLN
jgi:hypothetical protein